MQLLFICRFFFFCCFCLHFGKGTHENLAKTHEHHPMRHVNTTNLLHDISFFNTKKIRQSDISSDVDRNFCAGFSPHLGICLAVRQDTAFRRKLFQLLHLSPRRNLFGKTKQQNNNNNNQNSPEVRSFVLVLHLVPSKFSIEIFFMHTLLEMKFRFYSFFCPARQDIFFCSLSFKIHSLG